MKKLILSIGIAVFAFSVKTSAQVGINTAIPTATLDITAKNTAGNSSNVDGLLIPRVDRQRAQSMTSVPTSTLVYINSITTGSQTGTAINIDATGYYYYNGTAWAKLNPSAPTITNIYNADGSLTGNRTVTQGNNTLAFKANSVNAFSVNNAFSVDAANNRVGIGTSTPQTRLDVVTEKNAYGIQHSDGTIRLRTYLGSDAWLGTQSNHSLFLITSNIGRLIIEANGNVAISPNIFYANVSNAKIGIGTTTPSATLEINSNANNISGLKFSKFNSSTPVGTGQTIGVDNNGNIITVPNPTGVTNIYNTDGSLTGNRTVTQGNNTLAFKANSVNAFSVNSAFSIDAANNRVGIGTTTPLGKLHITGTNYDPKANDEGTEGNYATLRVDGNTNYSLDMGTVQSSPFGSYIQSHDKRNPAGLPLTINPNGGSVGIGVNPTQNVDSSKNAKLYINTATTSSSSDNVATLVRNENTGEVMAVRVGNNNRSFNYMTYQLNNVNRDWLNNFDTKIASADYTVIVTGIFFSGPTEIKPTNSGTYNPLNFGAFIENGTWRLRADYNGGAPDTNGNWIINTLIISNSIIKNLPTQTFNLNGSNSGSASGSPAGL